MKNPATSDIQLSVAASGRLALVKGEGTVRDNLRRVEGHEPLTSILSPSKMGEAAVYQVDDDLVAEGADTRRPSRSTAYQRVERKTPWERCSFTEE